MQDVHHDLASEMPEYKDLIHELKGKDAHFTRLFEEYNDVDKKVHRIEQDIETASDAHWEDMKKKRLQLKDELVAILEKAKAA